MGVVSKGIAALVILGVAYMMISAYGDARFDQGWSKATEAQAKAARELADAAKAEKDESNRRLEALQATLNVTIDEKNRIKDEALHRDEEYVKWRNTSIHPVARCRIWNLDCPAN